MPAVVTTTSTTSHCLILATIRSQHQNSNLSSRRTIRLRDDPVVLRPCKCLQIELMTDEPCINAQAIYLTIMPPSSRRQSHSQLDHALQAAHRDCESFFTGAGRIFSAAEPATCKRPRRFPLRCLVHRIIPSLTRPLWSARRRSREEPAAG